MNLYRIESSDHKANAQRNLEGRSHYVSDSNLRFHKSRIISSHVCYEGLLFAIVESHAVDMNNTSREFRPVVFDVFGTVISKCDLGKGYSTSKAATKAMWDAVNAIDAVAHTQAEIDRQQRYALQEFDSMRATVAKMQRKAA